ncbi:MAG TPA: hypothetical protein VFN26_22775 [Candidatus Acidoferrum sp.]|nr:hypothetical protein [Candidatus Acidoferrum sp.]
MSNSTCGDRTATGKIVCTIIEPVVTQHETVYPTVAFAPGDIVDIQADGCVQTGGSGDTWKRYVNPTGSNTDHLYHGLIRIPTAMPAGSGLVRIRTVIGKRQTVTGAGVPVSQLVLHLGYEDDNYSDNGYYSHDNGNDDQCKIEGNNDGGPAHVTITIYRGVSPETPESRFNFDVLSSSVDPNGLPYNPQWAWQQQPVNHGQIPNTSLCHNFSKSEWVGGLPSPIPAANFPDCTDQADLSTVDEPWGWDREVCRAGRIFGDSFAGHVNWFPVTIEGKAFWGNHEWADNDYDFSFVNDGDSDVSLYSNDRRYLHVEFDSDETIRQFTDDEWVTFRQAVDDDSKDSKDVARQHFDGHTILTGMFGLDGEHSMKSELHPLYAIATRRDNYENDPRDDVWLIFVRNRGDEGYCSSQLWDAGFEDYTFRLPWLPGMTSVEVNWSKTQFSGTDGTSPPIVAVLPPPAIAAPRAKRYSGVYVTFHLGPAASSPFIDGALHLVWTGPPVASLLPPVPSVAGHNISHPGLSDRPPAVMVHGQGGAANEADEVEHSLQAAINRLPAEQRLEVQKARAIAGVRPAVHRLPPGGPARRITAPPAIPRISRLHAIKAGPATQKAQRDAAQMRALCAATHNAPAGLPANICTSNVREHP